MIRQRERKRERDECTHGAPSLCVHVYILTGCSGVFQAAPDSPGVFFSFSSLLLCFFFCFFFYPLPICG